MEEGWNERVREKRARQGSQEVVTLFVETTTPRRRILSESYLRECTPAGELPPGRRARHSAESSCRSRRMGKLRDKYLGKELRKRNPAEKKAVRQKPVPVRLDSDWQRREVERQEARSKVSRPLTKASTRCLTNRIETDMHANVSHLTQEQFAQECKEREERKEREREEGEHRKESLRRYEKQWYLGRCGECTPCLGKAVLCARNVCRAALPCEVWLSREQYTGSERAELLELARTQRPEHTYGFVSLEAFSRYIASQQDL